MSADWLVLLDMYGKACLRAGQSNSGAAFDPCGADDMQQARVAKDKVVAEIDRLLAELKPLAKTEDGVPVYVGMAVWTREAGVVTEWTIQEIHTGCVLVKHPRGSVFTRLLTELYSTREAAEEGATG